MKKLMLCLVGVMFFLTGALACPSEQLCTTVTIKNDTKEPLSFSSCTLIGAPLPFKWKDGSGRLMQPGEARRIGLIAFDDEPPMPPSWLMHWKVGLSRYAPDDYKGSQDCAGLSLSHIDNTLDIDIVNYNEKASAFTATIADQDGNICAMAIPKN